MSQLQRWMSRSKRWFWSFSNRCKKNLASPRCLSPTTWQLLTWSRIQWRSEEHTSELQSRGHLVCRLLLEKQKHGQEGHSECIVTAGQVHHCTVVSHETQR